MDSCRLAVFANWLAVVRTTEKAVSFFLAVVVSCFFPVFRRQIPRRQNFPELARVNPRYTEPRVDKNCVLGLS